MVDIKYDDLFMCKITVMGSSAVGKTAIVNRLVNNYFPLIYEPTTKVDNYSFLFNLNEYEIREKTHVAVTLEDMFGLNNPLLQTPDNLITSAEQKEQRAMMTSVFKEIMFTSTEKRKLLSNELKKAKNATASVKKNSKLNVYDKIFNDDPQIERRGFILVCDCTDIKTVEDLRIIIEKLHQIEKTNNLFYPKCILLNKIDRVDKEKLKSVLKEVESFRSRYKIDIMKISALTNYGVVESFKKFVSKIHQQEVENKQNEGCEDQDEDEEDLDKVECFLTIRLHAMIS